MNLEQLTIATLAIATALALYQAGRKKVWVWGYQLADMTEDRDFWRGLYLRTFEAAAQVVEVSPGADPPAPARGTQPRRPARGRGRNG